MSGSDAERETGGIEMSLRATAAKLKGFRGPFLGDGIRPALNGYELAEVLVQAADELKAAAVETAVTQEMVFAAIKEGVAQGLLPAKVQGEAAYLRVHEQVQAMLAAAMKAKGE